MRCPQTRSPCRPRRVRDIIHVQGRLGGPPSVSDFIYQLVTYVLVCLGIAKRSSTHDTTVSLLRDEGRLPPLTHQFVARLLPILHVLDCTKPHCITLQKGGSRKEYAAATSEAHTRRHCRQRFEGTLLLCTDAATLRLRPCHWNTLRSAVTIFAAAAIASDAQALVVKAVDADVILVCRVNRCEVAGDAGRRLPISNLQVHQSRFLHMSRCRAVERARNMSQGSNMHVYLAPAALFCQFSSAAVVKPRTGFKI